MEVTGSKSSAAHAFRRSFAMSGILRTTRLAAICVNLDEIDVTHQHLGLVRRSVR